MANICIDCGICCDGTMFSDVTLHEEDDVARLADLGVVDASGAEPRHPQPCAAFRDGCCRIYDERPAACRGFRCALLERFDAGEVAEDEARRLIATARGLAASVRTALPEGDGLWLSQRAGALLREIASSADPRRARIDKSAVLADLVALDVLVKRHFARASADPGEAG